MSFSVSTTCPPNDVRGELDAEMERYFEHRDQEASQTKASMAACDLGCKLAANISAELGGNAAQVYVSVVGHSNEAYEKRGGSANDNLSVKMEVVRYLSEDEDAS